ncbi:hypothetical protein BCR44DRAFT_48726 [Catenaria anguillulae PL171]|uniref:Uncharacterized protein n=1 Tax=Catenaria anguillulae PL171 TaxID=765915 RepID=A0A1Y2HRT6_9FUNG|nr:hypothetical protein BCR44DRAFT_48726 [Catenaria anguillulae PL171]
MSSAIRILNFGNLLPPSDGGRTEIGRAICPGASFINRLDFETNQYEGFGHPFLHGLRVYCSGIPATPPVSIHYLINPPDPSVSKLEQVEGKVSPNGIREAVVYAQDYVNLFGYPGSFAGDPTGPRWEQARSEVAGCLLKGVELYYVLWVDGMRLHFDCSSQSPTLPPDLPPPLPPLPTSAPPATVTVSVTVTVTVIIPPPTPVTSTIVVGTGASASTIVTVIMHTPPPVTMTLSQAIGTPAPPAAAATTVFAIDTASSTARAANDSDLELSPWLMGVLAGLAIVLVGLVFAMLGLLVRQRQRRRRRGRERCEQVPTPLEMADRSVPPDVDPPAYIVVPISSMGVVQDIPLELADRQGPSGQKAKAEIGMGEEDGPCGNEGGHKTVARQAKREVAMV